MNEIRRSEIEITAETFHACILKANAKIEASLKLIGVKGEALNNVTDDSEFGDSKFLDMSTFPNSYLICKLNTDLVTKTFSFELYRLVC